MTEPIRIELPTFFGMRTVNAYLFKDPIPTLIDCGEDCDASWNALLSVLQDHGLKVMDIGRLIITHAHVDHMGMARRVMEASGAEVWINEMSEGWAFQLEENWARRSLIMRNELSGFYHGQAAAELSEGFEQISQQILALWKPLPPDQVRIFPKAGQIELGGGEWETLYLPGHSNTQCGFLNQYTGHFISADMLLKITPTPVMEEDPDKPGHRDIGIVKLIDSFNRLLEVDIDKVFPGHYEEFHDAHELINRQLERIQHRKNQCYQLIKSGVHDIFRIFNEMYGSGWNLPAFNMLIGYLDLLKLEGLIRTEKQREKHVIVPY